MNEQWIALKKFISNVVEMCEKDDDSQYISAYEEVLKEMYALKKTQQQTNFDKIKAMKIEEMAEFISEGKWSTEVCHYCPKEKMPCGQFSCSKAFKCWLESEVTE